MKLEPNPHGRKLSFRISSRGTLTLRWRSPLFGKKSKRERRRIRRRYERMREASQDAVITLDRYDRERRPWTSSARLRML